MKPEIAWAFVGMSILLPVAAALYGWGLGTMGFLEERGKAIDKLMRDLGLR